MNVFGRPAGYGPTTGVVQLGGRRVLVAADRSTAAGRDEPRCTVTFALSRGAGGVTVVDGRFGTDLCRVVRTVAAKIIPRAG